MRTVEELKQFYDQELSAYLKAHEETRKKVRLKVIFLHIAMLIITGAVIYALAISGYFSDSHQVDFPIWICVGIWGGLYFWLTSKYVDNFKKDIIAAIARFIENSIFYYPGRRITEGIFNNSKLFNTTADNVKSEDFFSGIIGQTRIDFAEVNCTYRFGKSESTIFKGLFFIVDFNKKFKGETFIIPDFAQKLMGGIGQKFQEMNSSRGELIKLEDPEFEKQFVVYGSDQVEARYILSPSLMQKITEYRKKADRKVRISFVNETMFVAIPFYKNLFEPSVMTTLLDFEPIREYFEHLQLAIGIVEDLNLNVQIWQNI